MKILITDDEIAYRELAQEILMPYGGCTLAGDGRQAVALFENGLNAGQPFRLVMLDIQMPLMDGLEALAAMRALENKYRVPAMEEAFIIMATTMNSPEYFTKALQYGGCSDYLVKPLTQKGVARILRENKLIEKG